MSVTIRLSLIALLVITVLTECSLQQRDSKACPLNCKCSETRLEDIGTIYKVVCSQQNLQKIPDLSVLKSVSVLIHLILNENEIRSVTSSDFPLGLTIDHLDLSRNKDVVIDVDALTNLAPTLTKLTLEATSLNFDSPLSMVSGLGRLKELSISHNNKKGYVTGAVDKIQIPIVSGPITSSLNVLNMANCGLRALGNNTFKHLTNLEVLDLSNNGFHDVPDAIRSLRKLKKLLLDRCNIKKLNDDTFLGLSLLAWLELSRNPIEKIEKYAFRGLESSLNRLSLERCKLKHIPTEEIKHLKKLEYLDLTMNDFNAAPVGSLVGEYCLKTLLLSGTNLRFDDDTFLGQSDCILDLTIKHMNLTFVPRSAISKLNKLRHLTLEKVQLKTLAKSALEGIKAKTISLAENDLTYIEPGAFFGLPRKVELNLRKSKISDIDFLLGYDEDAIATVNLDKTDLRCRCSMESSLNATVNIAIFGACYKNNQTSVPFDSYLLKSVLSQACEDERNTMTRLKGLLGLELMTFFCLLISWLGG